MVLHAGVTKVVTVAARKGLQTHQSVEFKRSWAKQAQTLATSARRHNIEQKPKPDAGQASDASTFHNLYDNTRDDVRRWAINFLG
jgi:hypothetical protein